jgi:hypothetical protein
MKQASSDLKGTTVRRISPLITAILCLLPTVSWAQWTTVATDNFTTKTPFTTASYTSLGTPATYNALYGENGNAWIDANQHFFVGELLSGQITNASATVTSLYEAGPAASVFLGTMSSSTFTITGVTLYAGNIVPGQVVNYTAAPYYYASPTTITAFSGSTVTTSQKPGVSQTGVFTGSVHGYSNGQTIIADSNFAAGSTIASQPTLTSLTLSSTATAAKSVASFIVPGGTPQVLGSVSAVSNGTGNYLVRPSISSINTRITATGTLYGTLDNIVLAPKCQISGTGPYSLGTGYAVEFRRGQCKHGYFLSGGGISNIATHATGDASNPYPNLNPSQRYIFQIAYLKTGTSTASISLTVADRATGNVLWTASDSATLGTGGSNSNNPYSAAIGVYQGGNEPTAAIEDVTIDCAPDSVLSVTSGSGSVNLQTSVTDNVTIYSATAAWKPGVYNTTGGNNPFTLSGGTGASLGQVRVVEQYPGAPFGEKAVVTITAGSAAGTVTLTDATQTGSNTLSIPVVTNGTTQTLSGGRLTALDSPSSTQIKLRVWPTSGGNGTYSVAIYRDKNPGFIPPGQGTLCSGGTFSGEANTGCQTFVYTPPDSKLWCYKAVYSDTGGNNPGPSASWCTDYAGYTFPTVRSAVGYSAQIVAFGDSKTGPYTTQQELLMAGANPALAVIAEGVGGTFFKSWDPSLANNYMTTSLITGKPNVSTGNVAIAFYSGNVATWYLGTNDSINAFTAASGTQAYTNIASNCAGLAQTPMCLVNYPDANPGSPDGCASYIVQYCDAIDDLVTAGTMEAGDKRASVCMVEDYGLQPVTVATPAGTLIAGNPVISVSSTTNLYPGESIGGSGFASTYIIAVDSVANTVTVAIPPNTPGSNIALTVQRTGVYDSTIIHYTALGAWRISRCWADAYVAAMSHHTSRYFTAAYRARRPGGSLRRGSRSSQ